MVLQMSFGAKKSHSPSAINIVIGTRHSRPASTGEGKGKAADHQTRFREDFDTDRFRRGAVSRRKQAKEAEQTTQIAGCTAHWQTDHSPRVPKASRTIHVCSVGAR